MADVTPSQQVEKPDGGIIVATVFDEGGIIPAALSLPLAMSP